ncbi:hypothetical protein [Streptomyces sp. NPDC059008]|uniref:hypothetical protein n=1 Tax=Streptomyces sp. NPDC059008 TaxID=3346693 RepID=UPI0036BDA581
MAGDQGHNADAENADAESADAESADAENGNAEKKSQFTWSDWIEGALLLVTGVSFVLWLMK